MRNRFCWYCAKQLPSMFTSVAKNGLTLFVHGECRQPALDLIGHRQPILENPDAFTAPAFVSEIPIG